MGRDKARLEIDGVRLAHGAASRLAEVCGTVVLADGGRGSAAGWTSIEDGPGRGPAAGLLGAAARHPRSRLLALACDLPRVPAELLARLAAPADRAADGEALVPRWQRGVEPLCACYLPSALARLAGRVAAPGSAGDDRRFALHSWLEDLDVRYLEGAELARFGSPEEIFLNLNRPEDLRHLVSGPATR
jgi:molybdopterin-guanine dinucleotide biosynthesis protein A